MKRKPRWHKSEVEWIVGRLHVGTSDADVRAEIARRIDNVRRKQHWTVREESECLDYAIAAHHRNRDLYNQVMSGRLG